MKLTFVLLSCFCAVVSIQGKPSQYSNYVNQAGDSASSAASSASSSSDEVGPYSSKYANQAGDSASSATSSASSSSDEFVPYTSEYANQAGDSASTGASSVSSSSDEFMPKESPYNQVSSSTNDMSGAATSATSGAGGAAASAGSGAGGAFSSASSNVGGFYKQVPYNEAFGPTVSSAAGPVSSVSGKYNDVQGVVPYKGVYSSVGSTAGSAAGPISSFSGIYDNNMKGVTSGVGPAVAVATGAPNTALAGFSPSFGPAGILSSIPDLPELPVSDFAPVSGLALPSPKSVVGGDSSPLQKFGGLTDTVQPTGKLDSFSSPINEKANTLPETFGHVSPSPDQFTGFGDAPQGALAGGSPVFDQASEFPDKLVGEGNPLKSFGDRK